MRGVEGDLPCYSITTSFNVDVDGLGLKRSRDVGRTFFKLFNVTSLETIVFTGLESDVTVLS